MCCLPSFISLKQTAEQERMMKRTIGITGIVSAMLIGVVTLMGGSPTAAGQGDVYSCPEGTVDLYKSDNLSGPTYVVPAGVVAVVVKAATEHRTYGPTLTEGQVLPVEADMGHEISHAHNCGSATEPTIPEPTVTEPTVTEPTVTEPTVTEPTVTEPTVTEPTTPESTPTSEVVGVQPPTTPPAPVTTVASGGPVPPAPAAPAQSLPSTGSSSWALVFLALAALGSGAGLITVTRRR
jgi:LPXTG-motif cell wall-anchored protein